ncbi:MAG TPA: hypothetical protein VM145_06265 [Sphingomicrobium sp.]|nr:hypothetical protein [Sphingomicrobium sp.]
MRLGCSIATIACLAGCAPAAAPPVAQPVVVRPLEVLQPGFDPALIRTDLIATARERFGAAAVQRALASPTHLFAKRFFGMGPPPPPGAPADWRPTMPAALLIKEGGHWLVATADGWRGARADAAAEIDAIMAKPGFWTEPVYTPPCPDYGADLLLLELPGKTETVRDSLCTSHSASIVQAALRA